MAASTRQAGIDAGWVGHSLRAWLENMRTWFGGSTLAALVSVWIVRRHVLGGWDIIWSEHWSAVTLVPLGYLLLLLGGWALLRRYLWGAALVTASTIFLATLVLVAFASELPEGRILDVGMLLFILASANMGLASGLACTLHVLARILDVPILQPRVAGD
jgi:hypothetical protein